jgi:hypothetical protein
MKNLLKKVLLLTVYFFSCHYCLVAQKNNFTKDKEVIALSAIKGTTSKPDTIDIEIPEGIKKVGDIKISGTNSKYFKILSHQLTTSKNEKVISNFSPPSDFVGIARAKLIITANTGKTLIEKDLVGLSTKGLEGENEASLSTIVDALGYVISLGWTSLANHSNPDVQGEELAPSLFKKAGDGVVEILPVARYSPDFPLSFGYYTPSGKGPEQHQVGILATAKKYPEHQTLFPSIEQGDKTFDPGDQSFGFYAISPTHTAYSEDIWNILFHPGNVRHASRIYPVKDKNGKLLINTYLICFEEAKNGDYNDYVFLVKNIIPLNIKEKFSSLFNEKDLKGWYKWLESKGKNNDPDKVFTVENGIIHDLGKELGYIMTEQSFNNYHFVLDFKWGEKKWVPRDTSKRDSGICYNVPDGEEDKIWPQSVECQIQEGDVGDFWLLEYSTIQVDGNQNPPSPHTRMTKKKDAEKPSGEWNTVEVINFNGKCVHIVNGVVVNYGENSSLTKGKILLQSEYAEVFYRNIGIREL